jgi:hypothetical protein
MPSPSVDTMWQEVRELKSRVCELEGNIVCNPPFEAMVDSDSIYPVDASDGKTIFYDDRPTYDTSCSKHIYDFNYISDAQLQDNSLTWIIGDSKGVLYQSTLLQMRTLIAEGESGAYVLPVATASVLGGIKVGNNLAIDAQTGVLSALAAPYSLPTASSTVLGGVKVGSGLAINSGILSATFSYTLPPATTSILGGIKVGAGLSIDINGVLSTGGYTLPIASSTVLGGIKVGAAFSINASGLFNLSPATASLLGGVKVGSGLSVDVNGLLAATYTLPIATASILGGVKQGSGVSIDASGVLTSPIYVLPPATATTLGGIIVGAGLSVDGAGKIITNFPLTKGSVPFSDGNGNLIQDNPNLFWDDTNNFLGIGTNAPGRQLTVNQNVRILTGGLEVTSDGYQGTFIKPTISPGYQKYISIDQVQCLMFFGNGNSDGGGGIYRGSDGGPSTANTNGMNFGELRLFSYSAWNSNGTGSPGGGNRQCCITFQTQDADTSEPAKGVMKMILLDTGQVGIGTIPLNTAGSGAKYNGISRSAILQIDSPNGAGYDTSPRGVLLPRLSKAQRDTLTSNAVNGVPPIGLMFFCTDDLSLNIYTGVGSQNGGSNGWTKVNLSNSN